jgi:hypothetical protein
MFQWLGIVAAALVIAVAGGGAAAQQRIAVRSGESIDLGPVYWVANCRSIMVGLPDIEVLEGPAELALSIREGMVVPRLQNCGNRVPGGTLVVTAKDVKEPADVRLAYRLKYKTKDGERVRGGIYSVSLYP